MLAPLPSGQYIHSMSRSRGRRRESVWDQHRAVMTVVRALLILASIIVLTEAIWSMVNQFHSRAYFLYSMGGIFAVLGLLHVAFPVELREEARVVWQGFTPSLMAVRLVGLLVFAIGAGMVALQILHAAPVQTP